jgi:hypothetical protein
MAKNDVVLLDAIIDERVVESYPSGQRDEVFEFFGFEQVLQDLDLSREEIESGWVDGADDGGLDGFFVLVNGHLVQDSGTFPWPKRHADLEVHILTIKHHDTFLQAPINALIATVPELLDFSKDDSALKGTYSPAILRARNRLQIAYRRLSVARPTVTFRFGYVSRGDPNAVAPNVRARADQLVTAAKDLFSQSKASFDFIGAPQLIELYRRTKRFALDLPVLEWITREAGSYVALARLDEYARFVTDEHGNLRRYLFDSNVRDYLGENRVNEDIAASLKDPASPDFWWLNNGVTLLTTAATAVGKVLQLQDVQIVNGLQTTESIFQHFASGSKVSPDRVLLVKVLVSADAVVRDKIIRATNNQNVVEGASLHATDKIQRDIEEVLERYDWYYERRKNYYRNIGKPPVRFVTPMYLAAGFVAVVMKNPAIASKLRARFMRTPEGYSSVFSESVPLQAWVTLTEILKRVEGVLARTQPRNTGERFMAKWRNLIALLTVARLLGRFSYGIADVVSLEMERVTDDVIGEMWTLVRSMSRKEEGAKWKDVRNRVFADECCFAASEKYGIADPQAVGRRKPPDPGKAKRVRPIPDEAILSAVNELLPAQPWRVGVHIPIAEKLGCERRVVSAAIDELMRRGLRMRQANGKVYDDAGKVVAVDQDRAKE